MKLNKFDIGAEIISILTKGMYPDPRDAVREYIQNSIDAKCQNINVKVRQSSIVIEDDGIGMDYDILRKALRVGVSDKRPGKDVGFMGIGIYSAFHLCNSLTIYTKQREKLPQMVKMNFKGMRELLEYEKEKRLKGELKSERLTDLQTLLETFIELPEKDTLEISEYPINHGTRIELFELDENLENLLNKFDELSEYLSSVIPLRFNKEKFKWGKLIEDKIEEVCTKYNQTFEMVNLNLQVGGKSSKLYRPYIDSEFNNNLPQEPKFHEIRDGHTFLGLSWACLNSSKNRISNVKLRGFLLKKQGFSIGKREDMEQYFGTSGSHFPRYSGEIIVVNNNLLPNAARNDLEVSSLKNRFIKKIQDEIAPFYNTISNRFQEEEKAKEVIESEGNALKQILIDFNPAETNSEILIKLSRQVDTIKTNISKKKNKVPTEERKKASDLYETAQKIERDILLRFSYLSNNRKKPANRQISKMEAAEVLEEYTAQEITIKFETLMNLVDNLEMKYSQEMKEFLVSIDELFIQALASNKEDYYKKLIELKNYYENSKL